MVARQSEKQSGQESPVPRDMLAKERLARALHLRRMGFSYAECAEQAGYADESGARKAIKKALNRVINERAQDLAVFNAQEFHLQLDRIDMALSQAVMPKIEQGGERLAAVNTLISLLKHQADLLGLYPKPEKDKVQPPTIVYRQTNFDPSEV